MFVHAGLNSSLPPLVTHCGDGLLEKVEYFARFSAMAFYGTDCYSGPASPIWAVPECSRTISAAPNDGDVWEDNEGEEAEVIFTPW